MKSSSVSLVVKRNCAKTKILQMSQIASKFPISFLLLRVVDLFFLSVPNCNECNECNELDTNYFFDYFAGFQEMVFFLKRNN